MKRNKEPLRDQPDLFVDLIRKEGLYRVLEKLATSCRYAADHSRNMLTHNSEGVCAVMCKNEASFFEDAALNVELAASQLRADWRGREPVAADGNMVRATKELGNTYIQGLLSRLVDSNSTEEDKQAAIAELGKESPMWIDNRTGRPSYEMAECFSTTVGLLASPETSSAEKATIALRVQEMMA